MSMQCFDSMVLCYHYMIATDQKLNSYATFDSGKRKWLNLRHDAAVVMLPDLCRVHRQMSRHHDEVFGIGPVWTRTRSRFPGFGPPLVSIGLATFSAFGGELKNPAKNESFLSKIITLGSTTLATWELTVRRCSLSK